MNTLADNIAWCYQHLSFSFVPLAGKQPIHLKWQEQPRESLEEALGWAKAGNVGARTGSNSGGIVVIDVDIGADAAFLQLPPTVTVVTGRGGRHYYYKSDLPIGNSVGKLSEHIDVRANRGQAVFVGSIHPDTGQAYEWLERHEPWSMAMAPLPANIPPLLEEKRPKQRAAPRPRQQGGHRLAAFILRAEVQALALAPEGTRNDTLNTVAFKLGQLIPGGYLDRATAESELHAAAIAAGLSEAETTRTIASGIDGGMKNPRQLEESKPAPSPKRQPKDDSEAPADSGPIPLGTRDPGTGKLVLSPRRTLPTAQAFIEEFHTHADGRTLQSYAGLPMSWQNNRYVEIEDECLRHKLQPWLHDALRYVVNKQTGEPELAPFDSNPGTINAALDSIRSYVHLPAATPMPSWLGDAPAAFDAREVLPCRTMNLHIPSGEMLPGTPRLFTGNALEFDYNPDAPAPRTWLAFLDQLWPDDPQQVQTLQEWLGYCLTADTSQQKILLMVGPKRSGKGTIGRLLTRLAGSANVVGPTTGSLAGSFGLQPLVGKSLAIVSDARFTGENIPIVVERLLCISGEDTLTIDRKFLPSVSMKLPTRFMLLTNELPRMTDASGALAGRFIMLRLVRSFYGQEDTTLTAKLVSELPGILLWAIQGWERLHERGSFVQPESVADAVRDMEDLASPVMAFVRDRCVVAPGNRIWVSELYEAWQNWCGQDGRTVATTKQTFGRDLSAAVPGVTRRRGAMDVTFYDGIALKEAAA